MPSLLKVEFETRRTWKRRKKYRQALHRRVRITVLLLTMLLVGGLILNELYFYH